MAQIGSGQGSGYPATIDTTQVWENAPVAAPDSNRRLDAEGFSDFGSAIVQIERTLGANPQGVYGSVAARLNALLGGAGASVGVYTFTEVTSFTIPGPVHNVGQGALIYKLYDAQIPANVMEIGSYSAMVNQATYDVTLTFATRTSGYIAIGATSPFYLRTFTGATTVTILGTAHQLGTSDLLFKVFDNADPANEIQAGGLSVHQTTHDVVLSFVTATSGFIILSAGGPGYAVNFTNTRFVTIPGNVHQLGSRGLLFNVYDTATPRNVMADPATTVHPNTYDVAMDFGIPLSGRIVLQPATTLTGRDFRITDAGVVGQSAVQVASGNGNLYLVAGGGNHIYLMDKTTIPRLVLDVATAGQAMLTTPNVLQLQGQDFSLSDSGTANINAARVASLGGAVHLQNGASPYIRLLSQNGVPTVIFDVPAAFLGLGLTPTHQLELSTNDAVKPGGGTWSAPSSRRLKASMVPFQEGLQTVLLLEPIRYQYNGLGGIRDTTSIFIGLDAEAVQSQAPYLVQSYQGKLHPEEEADVPQDLLAIDATALPYLLLNSIKELAHALSAEREARDQLAQQMAQLLQRVAALEARAVLPREDQP